MFERYTEKARRIIFFARYEASQFGSPYIETEHVLLGILREDKALTFRFFKVGQPESIRKQIEERTVHREKIAFSVDLPLSNESKRVLAYTAEEAERLSDKHIGPEHLLLGLLREEKSFAAEILMGCGLGLAGVRGNLQKQKERDPGQPPQEAPAYPSVFGGDLTLSAVEGRLLPVVGRDLQLSTLIQVLGRSTRKNAVLVGQPGVGKRSIVEGLAQRVAEGPVPLFLAERNIRELDVSQLASIRQSRAEGYLKQAKQELLSAGKAVLFMEEFYSLLAAAPSPCVFETIELFKTALLSGSMQCICTTIPEDFRKALEKHPWLRRCFRAIEVPPMTQEEASQVLVSAKGRYEQFHAVTFAEGALACVVRYADLYIKDRYFPDKALDLLDETAAYANVRSAHLPTEVMEAQKSIRFIAHRMENAIANHEFEKARYYSDEERKQRDALLEARRKYKLGEGTPTVTKEDVEEVLARWLNVPVSSIRSEKGPDRAPDA
jgi:ATP-dependent Clp protease ATP-binding subunit ClpC